jgi:hypothetical protein
MRKNTETRNDDDDDYYYYGRGIEEWHGRMQQSIREALMQKASGDDHASPE